MALEMVRLSKVIWTNCSLKLWMINLDLLTITHCLIGMLGLQQCITDLIKTFDTYFSVRLVYN